MLENSFIKALFSNLVPEKFSECSIKLARYTVCMLYKSVHSKKMHCVNRAGALKVQEFDQVIFLQSYAVAYCLYHTGYKFSAEAASFHTGISKWWRVTSNKAERKGRPKKKLLALVPQNQLCGPTQVFCCSQHKSKVGTEIKKKGEQGWKSDKSIKKNRSPKICLSRPVDSYK